MSSKIPIGKPSEAKSFPILEAGVYAARCFKMVHIGTNTEEFAGESKRLNKVRLFFEIPEEKLVFKEENGEEPRVVSEEFTLSLHEKANLRSFLETWRGKKFSDKDLENFELTNLLGAPGMITIVHSSSKDGGRTYANVGGMAKLMKGLKIEDQINETFSFGYEPFEPEKLEQLPDFLVKKIKTSEEYAIATGNAPEVTEADTKAEVIDEEINDDDMPF